MNEIGKIFNCNGVTIFNRLHEYNIKTRRNTERHKTVKYYCIDCGKQLNHYVKSTKRCWDCFAKFNRGKNHYNWNNGSSFEPYPLDWTNTYKEQIRYHDKYKCQICGVPEVECYRKLDVHHIDYNKQNLDPKNLISLCQSCHCKTNHNRKYWTKYFKTKEIIQCPSSV